MRIPEIDREIQKQAIKEAFKEYLNEQFAEFGKFSARALVSVAFAALAFMYVKSGGFIR